MNRRQIVSMFGMFPVAYLFGNVPIFNRQQSYTLRLLCKPKDGLKSFATVDEFWEHFFDPVAGELNSKFVQQGKIEQVNTFFAADGKSVYLEKRYRSKSDYEEYMSLWRQKSPNGQTLEEELLSYVFLES